MKPFLSCYFHAREGLKLDAAKVGDFPGLDRLSCMKNAPNLLNAGSNPITRIILYIMLS
jgi:hypothetical protein